jgi:hypothetical protein
MLIVLGFVSCCYGHREVIRAHCALEGKLAGCCILKTIDLVVCKGLSLLYNPLYAFSIQWYFR